MKWLGAVFILLALANASQTAAQIGEADDSKVAISFAKKADRKSIPIDLTTGHIAFDVEINGRKALAILDNLAARSVIDLDFAREMGVEIGAPSKPVTGGYGLTGEKLDAYRLSQRLTMRFPGQMTVTAPILGTDLRFLPKSHDKPIVLIVGYEYFHHLAFAVDFRTGSLTIAPSGAMPKGLPLSRVALTGTRATFPARIGEHALSLDLDLGSNGSVAITSLAWNRIGLRGGDRVGFGRNITGDTFSFAQAVLPELLIESLVVRQVWATSIPSYSGKSDGIAGMAVLRKFDAFVLDLKQESLWVANKPADAATAK